MKKIYFIVSFLFTAATASAQDAPAPELSEKKQQDIQALKIAFISKELSLTPDEAQKFWPVYNQYDQELTSVVKDNTDVLDRDEKVLNLRKKYRDRFTGILGNQDRMNRMFNAEGSFRKLLIRRLQQRQQMRGAMRNNRPLRN